MKSVWYACSAELTSALVEARPGRWWLSAVALALTTACSTDSSRDQPTIPLPTGHYEGPITYRGSELRVALDLREATPGQLQGDISFPENPGLSFPAGQLRYKEPQLRLEQDPTQPGGISLQALREGDFLRGVLSWDSAQVDFVWVRRGEAAPRGYREQEVKLRDVGLGQSATLRLPEDTLLRHPAIVVLGVPAAQAARLTRQGFVTLTLPTTIPTDSGATAAVSAALTLLRTQSAVDSSKVGLWSRGPATPWAVAAAAQAQPQATFVVLEGAPARTADEAKAYQVLSQQRIPALGHYAALDTSLNIPDNYRRLRGVLGARRNGMVRTYPRATAAFIVPGRAATNGQWQWPTPAPGYWEGLTDWLRLVTK
ncbi:hypothetical protein [Hymenobacter wooponensis]|uniref:Uncharacterized protein n=1 Tax=Hymenobacter wooponensis TaxID=1525360 RepID=A0A4Z0MQ67_9BACT|nr:hypothetical protein [Hymenobacter wooponensis]TGD81416.1 hypothetical protein EU557_07600 [Hymenobacter wooponensis]